MESIVNYTYDQFHVGDLLAMKSDSKLSVLIPARNEAATIADIINVIRSDFMEDTELIDEVIVINDASTDGTSVAARSAGASVIDLETKNGNPFGKGAALRKGIEASKGDILLFLDGDVRNFSGRFITAMVGPLLCSQNIVLCKPKYKRSDGATSFGGGRVTELVAKPSLGLLLPVLSQLEQPLAGESALRREVLEKILIEDNYKVEIALLIDVYNCYGIEAIAQVDLGERYHNSRDLMDLVPTAKDVLEVIFDRLITK